MSEFDSIEVSFIIIAYNARRTIRRCIESILEQDVDRQIILVDNNSTDGTADEVRDLPISILFEAERGRGQARNCGLEAANGRYIAFVDSDVELPNDWTQKSLKLLNEHPEVVAVGGPGLTPNGSWVSKASDVLQYGNNLNDEDHYVSSLPTMDILYRGHFVRTLRFSNFWVGEDSEFNFQLAETGCRFLWSRSLWVWHHHLTSLPQLVQKSFLYGGWLLAPYWKHPKSLTADIIVRVAFMPVALFLFIITVWYPSLVVLFVAWLVLPILGYGYIAFGVKIKLRLIERLQFVIVHCAKQYSQMAGIWAGLIKGTWKAFR